MRSLGVTVAPPATARPKSGRWLYVFPIFVQGFFFVTSASKSLGLDGLIARSKAGPSVVTENGPG